MLRWFAINMYIYILHNCEALMVYFKLCMINIQRDARIQIYSKDQL